MKLLLTFILSTLFVFPSSNNLNTELETLNLQSENYILYSVDTDKVLASKNEDKPLTIASIQKVLTAITALEMLEGQDLTQTIVADAESINGTSWQASIADLKANESYRIIDILYGILLPSGADATRVISTYLTQTPNGIVSNMNALANEIGMQDSHFVNASGLDADGQYTTLNDTLKLLKYALENEKFLELYSTVSYDFTVSDVRYEYENQILQGAIDRKFNYFVGAKSGYTTKTGHALSSIAKNEDAAYIFISTGAPVDFENHTGLTDAMKVYNYLFETYHNVTIDQALFSQEIDIQKRYKNYDYQLEETIHTLIPKSYNQENITVKNKLENSTVLTAGILKGDVLGQSEVYYEDQLIGVIPIVAQTDIDTDIEYIVLTALKWIGIITAILVILVVIIRTYNKRRYRKMSNFRNHRPRPSKRRY